VLLLPLAAEEVVVAPFVRCLMAVQGDRVVAPERLVLKKQ
jgi:hypothetical protein